MSTSDSATQILERSRWRRSLARTILVAAGLGLWFLTQALIGNRHDPTGDYDVVGALLTRGDALLVATEPINRFLHENHGWANGLLISSSAIIDLLGVFLLAQSIFGRTLRPFVGLLMLFALRQLSQGLCILPAPEQILWQSPGFPSLLVTYGVANDFFFSGHTAIAVYGAVEIGRMKGRAGILLGTMIVAFEATTVLVLRAHYTMDVLTGALAALCVADLAGRIALRVDRIVDGISTRAV